MPNFRFYVPVFVVFSLLSANWRAAEAQEVSELTQRKYPTPAYVQGLIGDSISLNHLGPKINGRYTEMSPIVAPDGKTLYFWVAKISQTNSDQDYGSQKIHVSRLTDNGWSQAVEAEKPLNTHELNAVLCFYDNGEKILIRNDRNNALGKGLKGFSVLNKSGQSWTDERSVSIDHYAKKAKGPFHGGVISNGGEAMILYFSETEGSTINDLYLAKKTGELSYGEPVPIKGLNSDKDEFAPYLASDNKTLFFTSNRFGGMGAEDIYVSRRLDDTWLNWSKPENVGYVINSNKYDGNLSIDQNGNAFLSSSRHSHKGIDIFGVNPITKTITKGPVDTLVIIQGNIVNSKTKQNVGVEGIINVQYEDIEMPLMEVPSYSDGTFIMEVPYGHKYKIWPGVENFLTDDEAYVDLTKVADGTFVAERDLYVTPIEIGTKVRLENIFFDYGKASLRPESFPELNKVVKFMDDYPSVEIEIAGHTDSDGGDDFNQRLSQDRATSVMNYIIQSGVSKARIRAVGYGEAKPVASNATDEGKQMNRRVEFEILKK